MASYGEQKRLRSNQWRTQSVLKTLSWWEENVHEQCAYLNPKNCEKSPAYTRSTVKSRNRQSLQENGVKKEANVFLNCEAEIVQEHEEMEGDINNEIIVDGEDSDSCHHKINQLEEENRKLKVENLALKAENALFCEKLSSKPNRLTF